MVRNLLARRVIALAAAYAIALQALFSALAVMHPAAADGLCVALSDQSDGGAPPARVGHDCPACPLSCGGGSAGLPIVATAVSIGLGASAALSPIARAAPFGSRDIRSGWARAPPV